ncbi:hypothetical protein KR51_00004630 [Rubidibacter lacunae KORDI 51-2]|uniref:Uncharacterized protein n=1 Tax=Rubidibacter lacunae KORDI 51-2 TaxID=582515 RepID=U5DQE9_9CHRO|nr:hypothetical protein KR51_00004630 [Rubidibacter lacunae KORDI 51-2]
MTSQAFSRVIIQEVYSVDRCEPNLIATNKLSVRE